MPEIDKNQSLTYKTGYPLNTYVLVIAPITFLTGFLIFNLNLAVLAVYVPIAMIIFYIFFSRYCSKIEISNHEMKIIYLVPWKKNITIDLLDFKYVDYARGFYSPFDSRRIGYMSLFRTPYDLIILSDNSTEGETEIKVNLRLFTFRKTIIHLEHHANLKLTKLRSVDEIIW